jgi:hypothetical protein
MCNRGARPYLAGACPLLPTPSSAAANASYAADTNGGAWDFLNQGVASSPSAAQCAEAVGNYLVVEGCCAATVVVARRRWRADVLSHPALGRRFRVAWGGGRLQVLGARRPSCPAAVHLSDGYSATFDRFCFFSTHFYSFSCFDYYFLGLRESSPPTAPTVSTAAWPHCLAEYESTNLTLAPDAGSLPTVVNETNTCVSTKLTAILEAVMRPI